MNEHNDTHDEHQESDGGDREVDAVGSTQMDLTDGQKMTTAFSSLQMGIQPGDVLKISGLSKQERIKNGQSRLIVAIETRMLPRGAGTNTSPKRLVTQYWAPDGILLAEADKWAADEISGLKAELHREVRAVLQLRRETEHGKKQLATAVDEMGKLRSEIAKLSEKKKNRVISKLITKKKTTKKKATKKKPTKKKTRGRK